jgi:hypothetical protein
MPPTPKTQKPKHLLGDLPKEEDDKTQKHKEKKVVKSEGQLHNDVAVVTALGTFLVTTPMIRMCQK